MYKRQVTLELADKIQNAAVPYVWIQTEERNVKVLSNLMVDLKAWVDVDEEDVYKRQLQGCYHIGVACVCGVFVFFPKRRQIQIS